MKKRIIAALCLLAVSLGFAACSCGNEIHTIEVKANGYYDKTSGINYSFAPSAYEPTAYEREVYGKDEFDCTYHRVSFVDGKLSDASEWLYAKDDGTLAYNGNNSLPSFDQLKSDTVNFCMEGTTSIILTTVDKTNEVAELVNIFKNGTPCKYQVGTASKIYYLKFVSSVYPIAYSIAYIEYENDHMEYEETDDLNGYEYREGVEYTVETRDGGGYTVRYNYGKYFIYDRDTGNFRVADYIHDKYIQ